MTTTTTTYPRRPCHGAQCDLLERAAGVSRVDRSAGVIHGVKIIGHRSSNRSKGHPRRYSASALREAIPLYEGADVFWEHPRETPSAPRPERDRIGWLRNVRASAGGLVGDLHLCQSCPRAAVILEAAENAPDMFGLSHNAIGREVVARGESVVVAIERVRSVDVVANPATTKSLFEDCGCGCGGKGDCGDLTEAAARDLLRRHGVMPKAPMVAALRRAKRAARAELAEAFANVGHLPRVFENSAQFVAAITR